MTVELPPSLIRFIRASVLTYQAAEVLLFLAAHPERALTADEIVASMKPAALTVPAARRYLALFLSQELIVEREGGFAYRPASGDVARAQLAHAYNERPVTLIKVIATMTDGGDHDNWFELKVIMLNSWLRPY